MVANRAVVSTKNKPASADAAGQTTPSSLHTSAARLRIAAPFRANAISPNAASLHEHAALDHRLRKHAEYQRVYREGRKQFSSSMSYFFALRSEASAALPGPRVGLTVGKVLGKAVDRNRIKRRLRDIVRRRVAIVTANVDIVLHPRRTVLTADFAKLEGEVVRIFTTVQGAIDKPASRGTKNQGSRDQGKSTQDEVKAAE